MVQNQFKILLVEDNPGHAELARRMLKRVCGGDSLVIVARLSEAIDLLEGEIFDLILLDLSLPDSEGLSTLARILDQAPSVPVVVTTAGEDDVMALKAVQMGAQDYLSKMNLTSSMLVRSIRYALERQRLLLELENSQKKEFTERELAAFERIQSGSVTRVTAQLYGRALLSDVAPEEFERFVVRYGKSLEQALEARGFRVEANVSGELRALADRLAFLKCGPRDIIEIHAACLRKKIEGVGPHKAAVYVEEGRILLLMLMGELASIYRTQSLGVRRSSEAAEPFNGD